MLDPLAPSLRRWCLFAAAASALPLWLQLPGWLAMVLAATALLSVFVQKQLPAALRFLLTLMLGGLVLAAYNFGIGRDTGCAGLLAMLVLKPFETFSTRDARSLLGFSLFAPFAAFLQDQGPLVWSLCVPAVLLNTMRASGGDGHCANRAGPGQAKNAQTCPGCRSPVELRVQFPAEGRASGSAERCPSGRSRRSGLALRRDLS